MYLIYIIILKKLNIIYYYNCIFMEKETTTIKVSMPVSKKLNWLKYQYDFRALDDVIAWLLKKVPVVDSLK